MDRHPEATSFTIERIGRAGDGAAMNGSFHIPFTLPGERVTATGTGSRTVLDTILSPSPERVAPPCPHFGACGGCALQHWADAPYASWKSGLVGQALDRAGFPDAVLTPLARTPPGGRRRMEFAVARSADGVRLGLHQVRSDRIVDIDVCPVLHKRLEALLAPLRALLPSLTGLRRSADLAVNLLDDDAVDLLIRADAPAQAGDRTRLAAFAQAQGIARIAWAVGSSAPETAAQSRAPSIGFGGIAVQPPPGAFLQASAAGQAAITEAVLAALPDRLPSRALVLELYAGVGTLSFPLSTKARVRAFEGDPASFAALRKAAGGTRVDAVQRDLARQPLQLPELKGASAIVLDPPYAGAAAQMPALAASGIPIIYVSCNPSILGRDAALLRQAGYSLASATPIDQFLWSAQVEAVCVFTRAPIGARAARGPAPPGRAHPARP